MNYSRREFCGLFGSVAIGSLLWSHRALAESTGDARGKKNVLFIAVDDLRPQLGCYGNRQIISPNIDKLAAGGMVFERAYCQQAICAPSRASVLSGCRPDTTKIYGLNTLLREAMPDVRSLPEHFRKNGYETVSIGKIYHHFRDDDLQGWSKAPFASRGDWKGRGYLAPESIRQVEQLTERLQAEGKRPRGVGPAFEAPDVPDEAYPDGMDANAAIDELRRMSDADASDGKPFFLAVGFHKPHLPFNAPKRYWDLYDPAKIDLADNSFAPQGVTKYSLSNSGELLQYLGIPNELPLSDELTRTLVHAYCACVSYVDAQIGRVLDELDRLGLADDTVVMLWGDHGWKLGEHGSWSKHTNFEIDAHAPLIVRAPGAIKPGSRSRALVEFVDMYPSLCELCELPRPNHLEGLSFAPVLADPTRPWKQAAFSQYPRANRVMGYTMRTDRYRYTEWINRDSRELLARELYDHQNDDAENINIASSPDRAALVQRLSNQLAEGWKAARPR